MHQPMLVGDASRPCPEEQVSQRFRLAESIGLVLLLFPGSVV
jgi:hypothetical protein